MPSNIVPLPWRNEASLVPNFVLHGYCEIILFSATKKWEVPLEVNLLKAPANYKLEKRRGGAEGFELARIPFMFSQTRGGRLLGLIASRFVVVCQPCRI